VLLSASLLLQGCHHPSDQHLKESVVGSWEEVHGTKETLQFNADGTLIMKSPSENHSCVYGFPDSEQIRIDCAPPGAPSRPGVWKISVTSDKLVISIDQEVGTYQRK
jgi:hypothetical protein